MPRFQPTFQAQNGPTSRRINKQTHAQQNSSTHQADPASHAVHRSTVPTTPTLHLAPQSAPPPSTTAARGSRRRGHLRVRLGISIIHTQGITTQSEKLCATHQRPVDCSIVNHAHSALEPPHIVWTAVRPDGLAFDVDGREGMSGAL